MKTLHSMAATVLLAGAVSFAVLGCKSESEKEAGMGHDAAMTSTAKAYPLNKCIVSGEALEPGKTYTFVRNGQEIKLCCKDCLTDFNKDPEKYLAKLNDAK